MPTRRAFLHVSGLAASALLVPSPLRTHAFAPVHEDALTLGLFFDTGALPDLRTRFTSDPLFAPLRERLAAVDRAAERRFLTFEVRYNDHLYHIARVSDTAQRMAFYYRMTGDEDAAALAIEALRTLMNFPKWDYFLEAGKHTFGLQRAPAATMATALGVDWLGELVDAEERSSWLRTMGERGLEASYLALYGMRYPDRVVGWTMDETSTYFEHRPGDRIDLSNWPTILNRTNLKAVPASALAVGTVAYEQAFGRSADTERWQEQAIFSIRTFEGLFARDGSYDEGVSYAGYTTLHLAQATAALRRFAGIDLYDILNWPGYVEYLQGMSMPTLHEPRGIVNFSDAGGGAGAAVPFWVAHRSHDRRSQWVGQNLASSYDEWALIWYDPSLEPASPPARPHVWHSALDWMVGRTGYEPDDLVVALRSGGPSNHEHADRNSLIVKAFGEELVTDPMRPPYSYSDPAWMMRTTAGHSALLIDGQGHQYHDGSEGTNASDAEARIVRTVEREGFFAWTSDATPAYRLVLPDVRSVTRTVIVLHELPAVLVVDKVLKTAQASRIQARFFAYNNDGNGRIETASDGFRTVRPAASLRAAAQAPSGLSVDAGHLPIPEETAQKYPFAEVGTREASLTPFLVTVLLPERGAGGAASAQIVVRDDGAYDVTCSNGSRTTHVRVFDTDTIPEFHVL